MTVNLAIQLRNQGKRVVILDADFGLANIEVLFGVVPKYNLADVISGNKTITEILTPGPMGIQFLSGGSGVQDLVKIKDYQLRYFVQNLNLLDKMADIILIDTGAGLSNTVLSFVKAASEIILITTPEPTSITDAYALIKTVKNEQEYGIPEMKLVVNRVDDEQEGKEVYNKLSQVCNKFLELSIAHLGNIPYDHFLVKAVKLQQSVSICYPKSNAAKAIERIADAIVDKTPDSKNTPQGMTSFMKKLMGIFHS